MVKIIRKDLNKLIGNSTKESSIEQKFLVDLCFSIQEGDYCDRKISKTYKPSSLNCIRNMYYQMIGEPIEKSKESPELIGICESGIDRHERLQKAINHLCKTYHKKDKYIWISVRDYIKEHKLDQIEIVKERGFETKCRHKGLNLSFMCDGILKINGIYYVLEIKTETLFKFQNRKEIDKDHLNQAGCYALAFEIDRVLFLYENRDNCSKKLFRHRVLHSDKEKVKNKILKCDGHVKEVSVPPKEKYKGCQYCRYRKNCGKDR